MIGKDKREGYGGMESPEGNPTAARTELEGQVREPPKRVARDVPPGYLRVRVHEHGSLEHNGKTYPPGSEIDVPEAVAKALGDTVKPVEE